MKVRVLHKLTPETAVPVHDLRDRLSCFDNLKSPIGWVGHFRGSPAKWKASDGEAILEAIKEAEENPLQRPVDARKLARRPKSFKAKIGSVTVPSDLEEPPEVETAKEASAHVEKQWQLLKLGNDMGLDVWVARNDRGREYKGKSFVAIPRIKRELPLQFDSVTNRIIEHIDVLWLQGNSIAAAFEIESTTSIYSGLLRMSDLIAMQPNLNIPLFLVAPDERRDKVFIEVNRPTFSRLKPPMCEMCRFISFSALNDALRTVASMVRYLKPDFLEEISESCEPEEE